MSGQRFARVTYDGPDGRRSVILRSLYIDDHRVIGTEVANDADGCGWHDVRPAGADSRTRVIARSLIVRFVPMAEDSRYGGLVAEAGR